MNFQKTLCLDNFRVIRDHLRIAAWDQPIPIKSYWLGKLSELNQWYTLDYNPESDWVQLEFFGVHDFAPEAIIVKIEGINSVLKTLDFLTEFPDD